MSVRIRYFAWVKERVGRAEETLDLPAGVETVGELAAWLAARGGGYAAAFPAGVVRAALDQVHAPAATPIGAAREIAFFPPVTGG